MSAEFDANTKRSLFQLGWGNKKRRRMLMGWKSRAGEVDGVPVVGYFKTVVNLQKKIILK